ncbi:MAG: FG-GAP repeat domain-containing protein, partial [Planctomycetota bacterium]
MSNTSQLSNQSNRWWVNMGGAQGGTQGFYTEQSAARWSGLGVAGQSSIAANQVLPTTGFIDFSCDCDFGDLDNDGDLDLVHSSYGGAFGGNVPTRLFLNNGAGVFAEFNPSGFQLAGQTIATGNPGIWCQGNQASNTTNSTGTNCDVASSALDIDVGDIDGDYDLDILHGARQEVPRMFRNLLSGTTLAFRDVTSATFPAGYSSGNGHYEQEMGDCDLDGDLDIYGLNWQVSVGFNDITLRNDGAGTYSNIQVLSGSGADDNEGDFLDYDNDGDLDLYVANFSGQDKLYRNNFTGTGNFSHSDVTSTSMPTANNTALDADCADLDQDGDTDVLVSNDSGQPEYYFKNLLNTVDTRIPRIPNL